MPEISNQNMALWLLRLDYFGKSDVNVMAADALAPCVAMSPEAAAMTYDRRVFVLW